MTENVKIFTVVDFQHTKCQKYPCIINKQTLFARENPQKCLLCLLSWLFFVTYLTKSMAKPYTPPEHYNSLVMKDIKIPNKNDQDNLQHLVCRSKAFELLKVTSEWENGKISNFTYLMFLNTLIGLIKWEVDCARSRQDMLVMDAFTKVRLFIEVLSN